jgi:hypothetical protein
MYLQEWCDPEIRNTGHDRYVNRLSMLPLGSAGTCRETAESIGYNDRLA